MSNEPSRLRLSIDNGEHGGLCRSRSALERFLFRFPGGVAGCGSRGSRGSRAAERVAVAKAHKCARRN
ncbi:hypothetical protein NDU88_003418 [Pleurodeles waltl]|uniref:Uncharacterized protein n=1 Tax=Pleurodeles waltl TaxID=8319 RepID=A0AAV7W5Y4_PLEWA|nr:hypothetical protein NDU88_003418 [Pleurodeles waltl]